MTGSALPTAAALYAGILGEHVLAAAGYPIIGDTCPVNLDANEAPWGPPEAVRARIAAAVADLELNRYPDPDAARLKAALAARLGVGADQLLLGVGSDELIEILLIATRGQGGGVVIPAPTFPMYRLTGRALGHAVTEVPLAPDLQLDRAGMLAAIERVRPAVVFLASPNNPTGARFRDADVEAVLDAAPGLVVVDEAYAEFAGRSVLPSLPRRPRLVVLRTFSKIGLAGIRLGYLVAWPPLVAELNKVRLPYNVSSLTQAAALAVLETPGVLDEPIRRIAAERERLAARLARLPGIVRVFPSDANFLFCQVRDPQRVYEGLKARGVLVKLIPPFDLAGGGRLPGGLRITVGTPAEHDRLLAALAEVLGDGN
ncbi:MAG TPA: histidinol-phosphate transaminase [Thermodesulfobacteriota bacterium]|nr:histidinol-phosphate transaminase [Thermodesulfobacteriota bacterium]